MYIHITLESKNSCKGYIDCIPTLPDAKQCATGFAPTYLILSWFHTVGHSLSSMALYTNLPPPFPHKKTPPPKPSNTFTHFIKQ
jgi:hypothetical protein